MAELKNWMRSKHLNWYTYHYILVLRTVVTTAFLQYLSIFTLATDTIIIQTWWSRYIREQVENYYELKLSASENIMVDET